MKTIKQFLIAAYLLLGLSVLGESPASSQVDTERVGRPALQIGADGFPANFKLTYDAIVSYYNDTVVRGYSSVYGPAVLEPTSGKSWATASGNDGGGAILRRLFAQPLSFRIADPKNNYVTVQANLQNADGQTILYGARGYKPVWSEKGGGGWGISFDDEGVQLSLSEKLPGLKIPGVDGIHILPKNANGGWAGQDYWVEQSCGDRGCGYNVFNFDLNRLPSHGQIILVRYEKAGAIQKSYDIGTGVPSEVSSQSAAFNGGIYGMKSFTDRGMATGEQLKATARIRRWEKSPLFDITVEDPGDIGARPIEISVVMVDDNDSIIATATSYQARVVSENGFDWSAPDGLKKGAVAGTLLKGRYYVIFGWPDGTFPEPGTTNQDKGSTEPETY